MPFSNIGVPPLSFAPYPPWSPKLVAVVDRAFGKAWGRLMQDHSTLIFSGDEDIITDQLKVELVALRSENQPPGFNSGLFGMPVRDAKLRDCHGKSIDQMPDLTIYPATSRPGITDEQHDALFFECKVLDKTRGMDLYRLNGIERFRMGRYAWRMRHAGMVAYVLEKAECSPTQALTDYFARPSKAGTTVGHELGVTTPPIQSAKAQNALVSDIAESQHQRSAPIIEGKTSVITLRHLWLIADPSFDTKTINA